MQIINNFNSLQFKSSASLHSLSSGALYSNKILSCPMEKFWRKSCEVLGNEWRSTWDSDGWFYRLAKINRTSGGAVEFVWTVKIGVRFLSTFNRDWLRYLYQSQNSGAVGLFICYLMWQRWLAVALCGDGKWEGVWLCWDVGGWFAMVGSAPHCDTDSAPVGGGSSGSGHDTGHCGHCTNTRQAPIICWTMFGVWIQHITTLW